MCFILEGYLKCECWLKLIWMQSVAVMLLIPIPDLLLRSLLAVSYCFPLRAFSAHLLSHTNTFLGLESATKFNSKSRASPKKPPPQYSICIHPAFGVSTRGPAVGQQSGASVFFIGLPQLTSLTPPPAGFDSAALWRM